MQVTKILKVELTQFELFNIVRTYIENHTQEELIEEENIKLLSNIEQYLTDNLKGN